MERKQLSTRLWLTALQLRLRFFAVLAGLGALFASWPWLSAVSDRWFARWSGQAAEQAVSSGTEYFCPMDPGVVSTWPAICPICNMDLVRRLKSDAILLPDGAVARMQLSPYKLTLAGVRTLPIRAAEAGDGTKVSESTASGVEPALNRLTVPVSAIVYWDRQPIVYVESMPGMFDAIPVTLQERAGDTQQIAAPLSPGQLVAVMGNFLLDAESRLKPNLSTQYFGAARQSESVAKPPELARQPLEAAGLAMSDEDQRLVNTQKRCPVTKAALGSMGPPLIVEVSGRRIALCCAGCRDRLQADPQKYIQWLDEQAVRASTADK